MNKIPNRQAICETLMAHAKNDDRIVALCSDSRGSASMTPFFQAFPGQSVEVGIAEQNLVSVAAGMAHCGEKPYCFSPACFLSTRSYEQAKVDVAYSNTNVKLIGISGGISYGELGMSHHSAQDIAAMSAIPNMRVYLPSDRFQTARLIENLLQDSRPAYVRVGRNPVEDIYDEADCPFEMDRATICRIKHIPGGKGPDGQCHERCYAHDMTDVKTDVVIIACGEMVGPAIEAAEILAEKGIDAVAVDMYCVKPLDREVVEQAAECARLIVTVEEHAPYGGLGSAVAMEVVAHCPRKVVAMALPDDHVITGKPGAVFDYYGLNAKGIAAKAMENLGG